MIGQKGGHSRIFGFIASNKFLVDWPSDARERLRAFPLRSIRQIDNLPRPDQLASSEWTRCYYYTAMQHVHNLSDHLSYAQKFGLRPSASPSKIINIQIL